MQVKQWRGRTGTNYREQSGPNGLTILSKFMQAHMSIYAHICRDLFGINACNLLQDRELFKTTIWCVILCILFEKMTKRQIPFNASLPTFLPWSGLSQAEVKNWEFSLAFPHVSQGPKYVMPEPPGDVLGVSWNGQWNRELNPHIPIWHVGVPDGMLTPRPNACP